MLLAGMSELNRELGLLNRLHIVDDHMTMHIFNDLSTFVLHGFADAFIFSLYVNNQTPNSQALHQRDSLLRRWEYRVNGEAIERRGPSLDDLESQVKRAFTLPTLICTINPSRRFSTIDLQRQQQMRRGTIWENVPSPAPVVPSISASPQVMEAIQVLHADLRILAERTRWLEQHHLDVCIQNILLAIQQPYFLKIVLEIVDPAANTNLWRIHYAFSERHALYRDPEEGLEQVLKIARLAPQSILRQYLLVDQEVFLKEPLAARQTFTRVTTWRIFYVSAKRSR